MTRSDSDMGRFALRGAILAVVAILGAAYADLVINGANGTAIVIRDNGAIYYRNLKKNSGSFPGSGALRVRYTGTNKMAVKADSLILAGDVYQNTTSFPASGLRFRKISTNQTNAQLTSSGHLYTRQNAYRMPYPRIDETSYWSIGSFDLGEIVNAKKRIDTSATGYSYDSVFASVRLIGVKKGTAYDSLVSTSKRVSETTAGYPDRMEYRGTYRFFTSDTIDATFAFWKNGKFNFSAQWRNGGPADSTRIFFRMDYAFRGQGDDICEFAWNQNSGAGAMDPPCGQQVLTYSKPAGDSIDYWSAVPHEVWVKFKSFLPDTNTVEKCAFARILDADTAPRQFGAILWPGDDSLDLIVKLRSNDAFPPTPSTATTVQDTGLNRWVSGICFYVRYAYQGRDQVSYVVLRHSPGNQDVVKEFGGKLFKRPNGRPLKYTIHAHQSIGEWVDSFTTMTVRPAATTPNGVNRTFMTAMCGEDAGYKGLMDSSLLNASVDRISMTAGYEPGDIVDDATLHNLVSNYRNQSLQEKENVAEWKVDAFLVDWQKGTAFGVMYDIYIYGNSIGQEASAVFWPRIMYVSKNPNSPRPTDEFPPHFTHPEEDTLLWAQRAAIWSTLHEVGHCLGFRHGWSVGNTSWVADGTIMSFLPHYAEKEGTLYRNRIRFNTDDSIPEQSKNIPRYYQLAPESWVKPGRYNCISIIRGKESYIMPYQTY